MSTTITTDKAGQVKSGTQAGPGTEGQPQVAPRKKHRWRRRLLIAAALLILLVALLPTLLSTGPGRGLIVGLVNRQIRGTVRIDDLSLGWLTECRARGVTVLDPQDRQVLTVGQVRWDRGLLKALTGGENYGWLIIDAPQADLYVKPDGTVSLQDALAMRTPSESKSNGKPSQASVAVTWTGARVRAIQPDGREYVPAADIAGELTLTSMNELEGKLTAALAGGSKLTASLSLRDFNDAGRYSLDKATGQGEIHTEPGVDLAPLLAFLRNQAEGSAGQGRLTIDVTAKVADAKASCRYALGAKGLAVPAGGSSPAAAAALAAGGNGGSPSTAPDASQVARRAIAPLDADLKGEVSYQAGKLTASTDLSSKLGTVKANLNYTTGGGAPAVSFEELVSALLAGQSIRLPDFTLDANGRFDLAEASRSIPGLLHLRPDVQITEGSLEFKDLHANGGTRPGAFGSIKLAMTAQRIGQGQTPRPMQPIQADFKLTSDEGGRVHLERADLDSSFATVHAKGDLPEIDGTFKTDLALCKQQLGEVFDLDNLILAGTINGTIKGNKADAAAVKLPSMTAHGRAVTVTINADAKSLEYGTIAKPAAPSAGQPGSGPPSPAQASKSYSGHLEWTETVYYDPDQSLVVLSGNGSLAKFILSTPNANGQPGREDFDVLGPDKLTVPHDLTYHFKTAALDVKEFKVDSKLISMAVNKGGSITDLTGRVILNLAGDYRLSWPEVTAFLNRFSPKAAESLYLALAGKSAAPITLNGPISNPAIATGGQLAGEAALAGGSAVGWEKGSKAMGMELDPAQIAFSLKDNILRVPKNSVPASGGTLTLAAVVDMTGRDPMAGPDKDKVLVIDGQLQVLDKMGLTEELGKALLSRALPLLGEVSTLEGKVSLSVKDVHLPLSRRITKVGRGAGHLDLSGVRLKPAGESAHLFKLLGFGSADALPVTISPFDFQLNEGALRFDNLTVTIGGGLDLDLKFRGEVRFDDSVNIVVSVPVRASVLEGLGVVGPVVQYAKALEGVRIEIPIVGSRLKSKLDLAKVDVKPLVAQAIKKIGTSGGGLLPEIIHLPK